MKEATSSLSSSGTVVGSVSVSSSSPPSSRGARTQWLLALSVRPARCHCALADLLSGTARVMSALRRGRAIGISCFHLCWMSFTDICCPLRHDAMSAAYYRVRVTFVCGRPSAVQTRSANFSPVLGGFSINCFCFCFCFSFCF